MKSSNLDKEIALKMASMRAQLKEMDKNLITIQEGGIIEQPFRDKDIEVYLRSQGIDPSNVTLESVFDEMKLTDKDSTWESVDSSIVIFAAVVGILADILITQTNILKPVDSAITDKLSNSRFKVLMEDISKELNNNNAAPIDYQDFDMHGIKSLHEQYSFAHDPLRCIEGFLQMCSGLYLGVDKDGKLVKKIYGGTAKNPLYSLISFVIHMCADFCNKNSLPYPGSTLIMQFESDDKVRKHFAAAYRAKVFNSRYFLYQNIPSFVTDTAIYCGLIFCNWCRHKKIDLGVTKTKKANEMILLANAVISLQNLGITSARICCGDFKSIFRFNWPQVVRTLKLAKADIIATVQGLKLAEERQKQVLNRIYKRNQD